MKLPVLSIAEILRAYRARELSPIEYMEHVLSRIEEHNPTINPAVSVPCGFAGNMPVGLQIVASRFDDVGCIAAAMAFEAAFGLPSRWPPLLP